MPFAISPALPSDIPYLSTIQWAALLSNPLIQTLYPEGPTPALTAFTRRSYEKALSFSSVRLIKATDVERGEIVAFAKWIVYPDEEADEDLIDLVKEEGEGEGKEEKVKPDGGWGKGNGEVAQRPEGVDEKALGAWNDIMTRTRRGIMGNRGHNCDTRAEEGTGCGLECYFKSIAPALWVLDIIHTHPSHQHRGAGAQLLKWGTFLADKLHMQCYVESSPAGYSLFKSHDFEDVTEMEIDLRRYRRKGFNGRNPYKYKHTVMIRPPDTPPRVPPKDVKVLQKQGEWNFALPDEEGSGESGERGISGRASLIDIKRSPRPDRSPQPSSSEKAESSSLSLDPHPQRTSSSDKGDVSSLSLSLHPGRTSSEKRASSLFSISGKFPAPPSRHDISEKQDQTETVVIG